MVRSRSAAVTITLVTLSLCAPLRAAVSTVVRFNSVVGTWDVRLYNTATPLTVANFLSYANSGRYNDSFIHRRATGFVIQGGGYTFTNSGGVVNIPEDPPVLNEFGISNLRGTIAMAKLGGDPNSATSEWFFSLADNSANLDFQNGGFTVFGRVLGTGMTTVDAIAALPIVNAGGAFNTLPVRNFTGGVIMDENLVNFNSIAVQAFTPGDYNFDGAVNTLDYNIWKADYGSTTKAEADGNGDGVVNAADYAIWRDNRTGAAVVAAGAVPEPGTMTILLAACGLAGWAARRTAAHKKAGLE